MKKHIRQNGPVEDKEGTTLARRLFRIFSVIIVALIAIILVVVAGLFVYEPSPAEGFSFSSKGKTIQLSDGRTLAYLDSGDPDGRPVFYFHGGPGSRLEGLLYNKLNKQLGIRMISIDRPGYGLSDFQENRTYLNWPDDVSELADKLGIDRFAVMGWSSGGPYVAAVAYKIPKRLTAAVIVAGEGPYASDDFPRGVMTGDTFSSSGINEMFIWSANNGSWLMRTLFRMMRILIFNDPVGLAENSSGVDLLAKDKQFFMRREFSAGMIEALRQGVEGMTRDFTIERLDWPFNLEDIHSPTVLVFHGREDMGVHSKTGEYVCMRIPSCTKATIYPGEGHSVVYYRYKEIIRAMLRVWK